MCTRYVASKQGIGSVLNPWVATGWMLSVHFVQSMFALSVMETSGSTDDGGRLCGVGFCLQGCFAVLRFILSVSARLTINTSSEGICSAQIPMVKDYAVNQETKTSTLT